MKIKENIPNSTMFNFLDTNSTDIEREILKLDVKKSTPENDIPTKILHKTHDIVSNYLSDSYNKAKNNGEYPASLKMADLLPIHKKCDKTSKKNYRPVSLIPTISKIYEKIMYKDMINYLENSLSPYLFGFRKNHSTEQCLATLLEAWKNALDKKGYAGAILTDLSKAFDCINHNLLLAKLKAYGFSHNALKFLCSYLKGRIQRTKVGPVFSKWKEIRFGVPQGSILGPLLFNIFLNDMFFFVKDTCIANYADDNTPYATDDNLNNLLDVLKQDTNILLEWFKVNEMKPNPDKCHLIIANQDDTFTVKLGNEVISNEKSVDLLGIKFDRNLKFDDHVNKLYKKGNQKLHALARIARYLDSEKLKMLMNTFITSQFNYSPLIWMFHSRALNNKINKLHKRALRLAYNDQNSSLEELLGRDNSMCIHHRNIQHLAIEMYKVKHNLSPKPFANIFTSSLSSYDLRNKRYWQPRNVRTVNYGTETISFRGPKTWDIVPVDIKNSKTLLEFKSKIKKWKPSDCTCRLCKIYINNLGFM